MTYSKIQKIISSFLLFIFFFGQVFGLSFFSLFSNIANAQNKEFHDLVSIIVDEKVYNKLDDEIKRYAEDIQKYRENTKVVILPVKKTTTAFEIASMNEKLFYEGYKGLNKNIDFESKLIGTILIGNIELPIVGDGEKTTKSVLPFSDFEDKQFIYNPKTKIFEKNNENLNGIKPEIFSSIISPNTGDENENIKKIKDFLDKDHDFYTGKNLFDSKKEVLNGKVGEKINKNYKPYVFYFDGIREQKSLSYIKFVGYETYLKNKEDLSYYRYSQNLNNNIQKDIEKGKSLEMNDILNGVKDEKIKELFKNTGKIDTKNAPDISLRHIITSSVNKFLEIFNKGTLTDFRTNVHNAGRYNDGLNKVNVDMIPYLISILDNITDKGLKNFNTDLEDTIYNKLRPEIIHVPIPISITVNEGLPKKIGGGNDSKGFHFEKGEIPIGYKYNGKGIPPEFFIHSKELSAGDIIFSEDGVCIKGIQNEFKNTFDFFGKNNCDGLYIKRKVFAQILDIEGYYADAHGNVEFQLKTGEDVIMRDHAFRKIIEGFSSKYYNIYNGKAAEYLDAFKGPIQCSINRGSSNNSGQVVEQNHGFNPRNGEKDSDLIKNCRKLDIPFESIKPDFSLGHWGGNSIINFDSTDGIKIKLKKRDKTLAIEDLFDPMGSQITEKATTPSILDCYNFNYILTYKPINTSDPSKEAEMMGVSGLPGINRFYENPYRVPLEFSMDKPLKRIPPINWTCNSENQKFDNFKHTPYGRKYVFSNLDPESGFLTEAKKLGEVVNDDNSKSDGVNSAEDCLINGIQLWQTPMMGESRKLLGASTFKDHEGNTVICPITRYRYDFSSIDGYIKHHYPDKDNLNLQLKNPGIPNLPIDRDRYIEIFTGDFLKFKYPYLYRVKIDPKKDFVIKNGKKQYYTLETAKKALDRALEEYDASTNNALEIKKYVTEHKDIEVDIGGEKKKFNYYNFLVFLVLWNNLNNVSSKYKFVLKNYLSDQVGGNDFKFILPKNKKLYEIAYLGAHGDSQNMYIKIDPKEKINTNPYSDIFSKNKLLNSNKISVSVLNGTNKINYNIGDLENLPSTNYEEGLFKCAPPEGVPIWEWIPAVMCRLKDLLPPKISLESGKCSSNDMFEDDDKAEYYDNLEKQKKQEQDYEKNHGTSDANKNGIGDICENKIKSGKLKLYTDFSRYAFNSNGILKTEILDKFGKRIILDNYSFIHYNLKKIIDKETKKIVFDSSKDNFKDKQDIIRKYISFNEKKLKNRAGISKYSFSTKDKEADIIFEASSILKPSYTNKIGANSSIIANIKSNPVTIKIRNSRLFLNAKLIKDGKQYFEREVEANDKTNIYLYDNKKTKLDLNGVNNNSLVFSILNFDKNGDRKNINYPITIILKNDNGKIIKQEKLNNLNGIKEFSSIKKSGTYNLEIIDSYKYNTKIKFEVLPGKANKVNIDLGTNILQTKKGISNNLVSIYDKFDNIISGENFDIKAQILGDSIKFDNNSKELNLSTYKGYKVLRLKATNNTGISKLKVDVYKNGKNILSSSKNIKVIDNIKLNLKLDKTLEVGNKEYEAELEFLDKNNNLLSNLNSRVYLSSGKEYLSFDKDYYDIINGKAKVKLKTKTLAGENKQIIFRIEGFDSTLYKNISILPGKAFGLVFSNTKTNLEADTQISSFINLELKDIYNNTVFTDSSSKISLELLDKYKDIISVDNGELQKTLNKGKVSFKINTTENPGKAYLKFTINKKLEDNEFIIGEGEKQLKINGVSSNAIEINTYFFYKKKSIEKHKYNALYTTLLGASYGDITQKDYLAGAMLFDKNNRSLAVTSLLNNPYNDLDFLNLRSDGTIKKVYDKSDLSQDLTISLKKDLDKNLYYLDLFNSALNTYIGKVYLNFENLKITENIVRKIENSSEINLKELFNLKELNVYDAGNKIKLNSLIENKKNSLIIYLSSNDYKVKDLYDKTGSSKSIYYLDPFKTKYSLNHFARYNLYSYDNFEKNGDLGWKAGNKTLLAFAAGESVGDATKNYIGVSSINLGDPIISLKKIKKKSYGIEKKFDSTIGKRLNKNDIKNYKVFDYNADGKKDILLVEENGFLSLLENISASKDFLNQKHLARIIDLGNTDLIGTGDFSGDGFDDIFFVNDKGNPYLLDNNKKDFVRVDLTKEFNLSGKIIQAKVFDMDNDKLDDIVTLDTSGAITIFYSKKNSLKFDKKVVSSGYDISLKNTKRNDLGAVYFDGLIQKVKGENTKDSTKYRNVDLLENLMFETIAYDPEIDPTKQNYTKNTKFIKSQFAGEEGLKIEKTYKDINGGKLKVGDEIEVNVKIKNTLKRKLNKIVYLEDIPRFFSFNGVNTVRTDKKTTIRGAISHYKFFIDKFSLNPGSELNIKYKVKLKSISFSYIKVGLFETGEAGDDPYGDIIVSKSKYNCGGNTDIFRSIAKREYKKGIKEQICEEEKLPEELQKNNIDKDNNGIPDYIDKIKVEDYENPTQEEIENIQNYSETSLEEIANESKINEDSNLLDNLDKLNEKVDELSSDIDNIIDGFSCGFGGGSCFAMPINWAPLAPGNDISTPFGLIGDGLWIHEGVPVFSTLTGIQTFHGCIPSTWPISPFAYVPGPTCGLPSAGGYLGTWAPTNYFRLFVTPTLTGGIGTAACYGGPAEVAGQVPPQPVTPFIPGGNCIIAAAPLPNLCKDEEKNANLESIGPINYIGGIGNGGDGNGGKYGVINGNCEFSNNKKLPISNKIDTSLAREYLKYRRTGKQTNTLISKIDSSFKDLGNNTDYSSSIINNGPLISIGGNDVEDSDISVSFNSENGLKFRAVEELQMQRIAPFPRFITQWVNDQLEEFITKLVDFPTLFVILPDFSTLLSGDFGGKNGNKDKYNLIKNSFLKQPSGIKEAYEFLGNIPFVKLDSEVVNINIPWIDRQSLENVINQRKLALESYPEQIEEAFKSGKYSPESILSAREFMKSLEINLSIIETYKDIPGMISKLTRKKQDYLEQILCNIETIEDVTGGWISKNGKRFKAWVELFILIKAILKSWQALADIFIDYDAECHECKNERWDSTQWEWTMISIIIPPIPVIKFPKWPDIVLDLHDIRLSLNITLPEFKFNKRPIVLPPAPLVLLPDYNFRLPKLPILPRLEIPELPDLPSIPTVKLPDLPPPPSLPKIWSSIEGFLNILKLITKAMCFLKKIPLVPEHRAGDQIAFLTEGGGYRPFDFIDKLLPNFSYPYLDEIKVTGYVNLEFDADFITEMARILVSPVNKFSNDFSQMFNKNFDNIDLTKYSKSAYEKVNSKEFLSLVNKELQKKSIVNNPRFNELRNSFDFVNTYSYSKENKIIKKLEKINYEKFDLLKSIIKKEVGDTKKLRQNIKNLVNKKYEQISNNKEDKIKIYNKSLSKYNNKFLNASKNLLNPSYFDTNSLKETGKNILGDIKNTTKKYDDFVENKYKNSFSKKLLAANNNSMNGTNSCGNSNSKYKRIYKGIYIIQKSGDKKISYKLFDYLDDLDGNEETTPIDYDLDKDEDLLYMMDSNLYLKENLEKRKTDKNYLSGIEVLDIEDNKFINGNIFYEAINNVKESFVGNNNLAISFSSNARDDISNYRLEYYSIIDKYLNEGNSSYIPKNITKNIVDSFAGIDDITKQKTATGFTIRKNLAYISDVGNNISKVILKTKKLINIKNSLKNGNIAVISAGTRLYTGDRNAKISYIVGENTKKEISIEKNTNIEFNNQIKIISISGDLYTKSYKNIILKGNEIYDYLGLAIFPETKIYYQDDFIKNSSSHIGIKYYDGTEANLDFRKLQSYRIYDLGIKSDNYIINLNTPNDYYYSRIFVFKDNIFGTKTSQILLSPQKEADKDPVEINLNKRIKIPVYQEKTIDITENIYENSGFENIKEFKIEGIEESKYKVFITPNTIKIKFGAFNKIFIKDIKFVITDSNGNISKKDIKFEVYSPRPKINSYLNNIISGEINEQLNSEPINLYRLRGGSLKRLETKNKKTKVYTNKGKYSFEVNNTISDLIDVKLNNLNIFSINEETGKINNLSSDYKIKIGKDKKDFIKIYINDKNNTEIFKEIIKSKFREINLVDSFDDIKDNGIYLNITNNDFSYYKIPDSTKYNPGSIVIYRKIDTKKEPLFVINPDLRIKTLNLFYKLEYSYLGDYIQLKLIDKHFNKQVGLLLLKLESSYLIK